MLTRLWRYLTRPYRRWKHNRYLRRRFLLARLYRAYLSIEATHNVLWPKPDTRTLVDPKGHLEHAMHQLKTYLVQVDHEVPEHWKGN